MIAQKNSELFYGPLDLEQTIQHYQDFVVYDGFQEFSTNQLSFDQFKELRVKYLTREQKYSRQAIQFLASGLVEAWSRDSQVADDMVWKAYALETMYPEHVEFMREAQYAHTA